MATVTAKFSEVGVLVGDGASPEVFTQLCLLNLSRSLDLTNAMQDDEIPDCTDVDAPASVNRQVRSKDLQVSGEGKLHVTNLSTMLNWWKDGEKKNVRLEVGTSGNGGQRISGEFFLSQFTITGQFAETATASVTLMPANTGALAVTALV